MKILGIPLLFYDPEYLGVVGPSSLLILGLSLGIFTMSFHIAAFILDGERYRFLAHEQNPFLQFMWNNSLIPFTYLISYLVFFMDFQSDKITNTWMSMVLESTAFLGGFLIIHAVTVFYFQQMGRGTIRQAARIIDHYIAKKPLLRAMSISWVRHLKNNPYRIDYFIRFPFTFSKTVHGQSGDPDHVRRVFNRYHLMALNLIVLIIVMLFFMGQFSEIKYFQIPAGASMLLFFAIILMFAGAIGYWLRGWSITFIILLLIGLNVVITEGWLKNDYQAFGLDYSKNSTYSIERLDKLTTDSIFKNDYEHGISMLNNWRQKFPTETKPKMVFICTSGGGIRSAVWSMRTLQYTDSLLNSNLFKQTMLITGASGGLIGASYYRELYHQNHIDYNFDYHSPKWVDKISQDLLNPLVFNLVAHDFLLRFSKKKDPVKGYKYLKDRGMALEHQLHVNTDSLLNKKLRHYRNAERFAEIPMVIIGPTIVNDGRRLYISSQPVSYMTHSYNPLSQVPYESKMIQGIEFSRFFASNNPLNLDFSSALRMNATFPYITPNVVLPSQPKMEIMDAGLSDNFGIGDAIKYINVFRSWIGENTSGIIILSIRDTPKQPAIKPYQKSSMITRLFNPIGSLYKIWASKQDNNNDMQIETLSKNAGFPVDYLVVQYLSKKDLAQLHGDFDMIKLNPNAERASLSWHLTEQEKLSIESAIHSEPNMRELEKLKQLLTNPQPNL